LELNKEGEMKSEHDDRSVKHWETRPEAAWKGFRFNPPYVQGLSRLQQEVLGKTNFDPSTLWQWGTMQAMAVIEILKTVEKKLGREGQQAVLESLYRVGYDVGRQATEGTSIPEDMTTAEWMSFYATVMNRIAYASLESPQVVNAKLVNFHIDWCPHQDHYRPFDCRVQRYFVQGMLDAAKDFLKGQGREVVWDLVVNTTIPAGSETCFFEIEQGDPAAPRKWIEYTRLLEKKALEIAKKGGK
jgi:hypothetical protein